MNIVISCKKNKYCNEKGKVVGEEDGKKIVFLNNHQENLFTFHKNEIKELNKKTTKCNMSFNCRKDFYNFIHKNPRKYTEAINLLLKTKKLELKSISKKSLLNKLEMLKPNEIIQELRELRNNDIISFSLKANNYSDRE